MQIGVGLSLPLLATRRSGGFSPLSLFTGGVQGAWYDPSDVLLNWRTNLLTWTQEFTNVAWSKNASTYSGTLLTSTNTAEASVNQSVGTQPNGPYTLTVRASAGSAGTFMYVRNILVNDGTPSGVATFNLENGSVVYAGSSFSSVTITAVGGGLYDCTVTSTKTGATAANRIDIGMTTSSTGGMTCSIGNSINIYRAQLELGSTATTYQAITTPEQTYLLYDPQPVLFQDSSGTTPVTAVEQPVGLMLDKSQGLAVLSTDQKISNSTFDSNITGWTAQYGSTVTWQSGGFMRTESTGTAAGMSSTPVTLVVGRYYRVVVTIGTGTSSLLTGIATAANSGIAENTGYQSTPGTYAFIFRATQTTMYVICGNGTSTAGAYRDIDSVSLVEYFAGNHASQATPTSRPVLRARYNLLTYSEQFDNAAWSKSSATITADAIISPIGTLTADKLVATAVNATHQIQQSGLTSTIATLSFYAKAAEETVISGWLVGASVGATFNLSTGIASLAGATACAMDAVGNGWYRCWVYSSTATTTANIYLRNGTGYLGDGVSGAYIWGAQLVTGSSAGTYQRIAAATDYATAGFLPYLAFDGTDDSFGTNSINFTATDKMSVCAGVTKLSDAAVGMLVELSADLAANNGSFSFYAPSAASPRYAFFSKGTFRADAEVVNTIYAAPQTSVLTGIGGISAPNVALRFNGAQVVNSTATQGTGNYGNYPLYIGRRNNASLPFNGRIYQMVVCGKTLSASELASTEAYVNSKTGAY